MPPAARPRPRLPAPTIRRMADAEPDAEPEAGVQPDARPPGPGWGLAEPIITFFLALAGAHIGVVVAALVTGGSVGDVSLATTVGSLVGLWVVYAGGVWFASVTRGSGRPLADVGLRIEGWADVGLGAVLGAASWIGVAIVYWIIQLI